VGTRGLPTFVLASMLLALTFGVSVGRAAAAEKNSCGCFKDDTGTCYCDKKAKCGCPGDCEPKGCSEAREKQIQKQIDAETKKAAEAGRRQPTRAKAEEDSEPGAGATSTPPKQNAEADAAAAGKAKKLTATQAKQLVKLLDLYFASYPEARAFSIEQVRNQLADSH
jgi:hypothetical protein